ncbi:MAG: NAD(P)/FAD-dependent oxidoreductase, partial [Lysobacter sp.]|nr:NAD(P)/FAD-dependent oxidoreductase [Lysobacter sp.]
MIRDRRQFISRLAAFCAAAGLPVFALADDDERRGTTGTPAPTLAATGLSGRVAVVGGGMAGAAVAKFLRLWGGAGVQVTLVEREAAYSSNILSNLVLTNTVAMSSLVFDYARLSSAYGISVLRGEAIAADPVARRLTVATASGTRVVDYDRLVVAPGIDFAYPEGLQTADAQARFPHAWKAGAQTTQLRDQIRAMPAGGTFVMTVPPSPYRCPPGPYERACVVADWLKRNKPGSKVIVLDANPAITAERESFTRAFEVTHAGVISYVPNAPVTFVDTASRTIHTPMGAFRGDVLNVIPTNTGPRLLADIGVANAAHGFAGVDVLSYESTAQPGIHVIGDAAATTQPKAGHIGNQEGKVCADAILRML